MPPSDAREAAQVQRAKAGGSGTQKERERARKRGRHLSGSLKKRYTGFKINI